MTPFDSTIGRRELLMTAAAVPLDLGVLTTALPIGMEVPAVSEKEKVFLQWARSHDWAPARILIEPIHSWLTSELGRIVPSDTPQFPSDAVTFAQGIPVVNQGLVDRWNARARVSIHADATVGEWVLDRWYNDYLLPRRAEWEARSMAMVDELVLHASENRAPFLRWLAAQENHAPADLMFLRHKYVTEMFLSHLRSAADPDFQAILLEARLRVAVLRRIPPSEFDRLVRQRQDLLKARRRADHSDYFRAGKPIVESPDPLLSAPSTLPAIDRETRLLREALRGMELTFDGVSRDALCLMEIEEALAAAQRLRQEILVAHRTYAGSRGARQRHAANPPPI